MVISYAGGECFNVSQCDLRLSFNPHAKGSSLASAKFGSDIALDSWDHPDFSGSENAAFGERQPFVIEGPGEYEIKGVAVRGYATNSTYDKRQTINTIYSVMLEGMNLCFLGAEGAKPEEKLTIKKKDLEGKEAEVVVLSH